MNIIRNAATAAIPSPIPPTPDKSSLPGINEINLVVPITAVIAKITPTGRMTTEKAGTYDHRGNRYPYQRYYYARLREWTEKEALAIRTAELVGRLKYKISEVIKMRNHIEWDVEDLETVWNILKKYERKEDD